MRGTSRGGPLHVYVGCRLVSTGGNGRARVTNLKPGNYPVLLWAPTRARRKTYWVTLRPGARAALKTTL